MQWRASFTILDRSDSADRLDLVRTKLGLSRTASRFPRKDTCLAIYSYTVNAGCPVRLTKAERVCMVSPLKGAGFEPSVPR